MTTDTDTLIARLSTVENLLPEERAALDSLAAELEEFRLALNASTLKNIDAEAELERVKAERDTALDTAEFHAEKRQAAEARLDKALAALREIEAWEPGRGGRREVARAVIAEIEGETHVSE